MAKYERRVHSFRLGANTKLSSRYFVDSAILGSSLASILFKIDKPSVGILNVGKEEIKGNDELRTPLTDYKNLINQT